MAQNQHGLRHGDYQRYREYCVRRIHRLRSALKFKNGKRRFEKKTITPALVTNVRFLQLVLFDAERAWAYAMQLKDESEDEPRKRQHMLRRFRVAVKHAALLEELCKEGNVSEQSVLEAQAYKCWLLGNLSLEKEEWQASLSNLVTASKIYEGLAEVAGTPEQKEIFEQRVHEIEPSVRYCKYSLQHDSGTAAGDAELLEKMAAEAAGPGLDILKSKLEHAIGDTIRRQATKLEYVSFRGEQVPVRSEKARVAVLNIREAEAEVDRLRRDPAAATFDDVLGRYGRLFGEYQGALDVVKGEITSLRAKEATAATPKQVQNLSALQEYLSFHLVNREIERNLILLESAERRLHKQTTGTFYQQAPEDEVRVEDVARIFDTLIQNHADLRDLRANDASADAAEFMKAVTAKLMSFKAMRCFTLSTSFAEANKLQEASALLDRAARYLLEAQNHHDECTRKDAELSKRLGSVEQEIRGARSRMHASKFAREVPASAVQDKMESAIGSGTVQENLQRFDFAPGQEAKIAPFPPNIEALACKPVLFDLASGFIDYPSFDAYDEAKPAEKEQSGGFWGFFRR